MIIRITPKDSAGVILVGKPSAAMDVILSILEILLILV